MFLSKAFDGLAYGLGGTLGVAAAMQLTTEVAPFFVHYYRVLFF